MHKDFTYNRYRPKGMLIAYTLFTILVIVVAGWQSRNFVGGPTLELAAGIDQAGFNVVENNIFDLDGKVAKVAHLYVNQEDRAVLDDNTFNYDLFVPVGFSTIELGVADRYGRTSSQSIRIYNPQIEVSEEELVKLADTAIKNFDRASTTN